MASDDLEKIESRGSKREEINIIIETPKGSRNKFTYDGGHRLFMLSSVLPTGMAFPYDFGFIPRTIGGDGDPLDVLLLMDEPAFTGCLVEARLIGVIQAEQTERDGKTTRNDRLLGVAIESHSYSQVRTLDDISRHLLDEIEHFFLSYNDARGKVFKSLGRFGPSEAMRVLQEAERRYSRKHRSASSNGSAKSATKRGGKSVAKRPKKGDP